MIWRIIADIILLLSVFWAPWWLFTLILVVVFIFLFPNFWESIIIGIVMDSIYGTAQVGPTGFIKTWIFTFSLLITFIIIRRIKKQLFI